MTPDVFTDRKLAGVPSIGDLVAWPTREEYKVADHIAGFYDAVICEQGHVINKVASRDRVSPEDSPFCGTCGSKTMRACGHCNGHIRGVRIPDKDTQLKEYFARKIDYGAPAYCEKCGHAFPWTAAKLLAGNDFVDLMEKISPEDKARLKADLPSLTAEGPGTAVAVARWKLALGKVGTDLYGIGMKVIGDLAAATVKGQLGL